MTPVQDPAVQRRLLRGELRRARNTAKLRQAEVAEAMDWSPSKLIRIEKGDVSVSTNDLRVLLSYYGVKDKERVNGLLELARSARGTSFYDRFSDLLQPGFTEFLAYEGSASVIRHYHPLLVPGLLQTEEYSRALAQDMGKLSPETADRFWAVRQHRQEVLDRDNPPEIRFILDESALRRPIGGTAVMRRQLERIRDITAEPHVTIQIMPFTRGAHPGLFGTFILLEFADPNLDDLVHLESINQATVRDDAELIARYLDMFSELEKLALSPPESVNFLDMLISIFRQPVESVDSA
jgi:transcriptional regulator with XRE-family HTH domain